MYDSYKYSAKLVVLVVHKLQSKLPKWAEEHFKKDYEVLGWDLLFNKIAVCVAHLIQTWGEWQVFCAAIRPVNKSAIPPTLVNGETNDRRRFLSFWSNIQNECVVKHFSVIFTRYLALEAMDLIIWICLVFEIIQKEVLYLISTVNICDFLTT